ESAVYPARTGKRWPASFQYAPDSNAKSATQELSAELSTVRPAIESQAGSDAAATRHNSASNATCCGDPRQERSRRKSAAVSKGSTQRHNRYSKRSKITGRNG